MFTVRRKVELVFWIFLLVFYLSQSARSQSISYSPESFTLRITCSESSCRSSSKTVAADFDYGNGSQIRLLTDQDGNATVSSTLDDWASTTGFVLAVRQGKVFDKVNDVETRIFWNFEWVFLRTLDVVRYCLNNRILHGNFTETGIFSPLEDLRPYVLDNYLVQRELASLKRLVRERVEHDLNTISLAFTNSESILRDLKVAYTFKTVHDILTGTFNTLADIRRNSTFNSALGSTKNPLSQAGLFFALTSARQNGSDLFFAFDKHRYSSEVKKLLEHASDSQPYQRFDSNRYYQSIAQSLKTLDLGIPYSSDWLKGCLCGERHSRLHPASIKPSSIDGSISYVSKGIIDHPRASSTQLRSRSEFVRILRDARRAVIQSKLSMSELELGLPDARLQGCSQKSIRISLGRVAMDNEVLRLAYENYDKGLELVQHSTLSNSIGGIASATELYLGERNQQARKVLEFVSTTTLAIDVGVLAIQNRFSSDPKEIIANKPQEMLLSLAIELRELLRLTDLVTHILRVHFCRRNPQGGCYPPVLD